MKTIQELTDWDVPNHVYFVSDAKDKMFGYVKRSTGELQEFNQPLPFSASRRKFKEIANTWNFIPKVVEVVETLGQQYKVPGSNGAIYIVTDDLGAWTCTCPASKWQKGDCKHVKKIRAG
jgi:SWIM zinc finger